MLSLMCVVAHPDDETILTGGLLAMLAARGAAVHVLCATRGEVGDPPVCDRPQLGAVREAEMVRAVGRLKAKSLTFLDYVDPTVGPGEELYPFEADLTVFAGQIAGSIEQHGANVVLTHGSNGEYGHPAHVLVHTAVKFAVMSLAPVLSQKDRGSDSPLLSGDGQGVRVEPPALYSFAASFPEHEYPRLANKDDPAHFVVDVTPWLDVKVAAAQCHKTQTSLFIRRRSEAAGRRLTLREVLLTREGLHRQWPPTDGAPDDALAQFLP